MELHLLLIVVIIILSGCDGIPLNRNSSLKESSSSANLKQDNKIQLKSKRAVVYSDYGNYADYYDNRQGSASSQFNQGSGAVNQPSTADILGNYVNYPDYFDNIQPQTRSQTQRPIIVTTVTRRPRRKHHRTTQLYTMWDLTRK